ncbi:uracil-DNA glycosylase [Labilibaculum filiforme]|uniref:Type-4 uracil-DNA glycosylase n=1 Tax=Labilibaculum filiforme TaxID=1940526 RepID=A0A2N3I3M4_9BACT|nr:uracil-DNA glycosylase [Labilibaculum filiforme]PKQ64853.1 uracil-DNA glycosylase [Labilibaculum filiforme]
MERLKERIVNCTACDLSKTRNHAIWGEGNPNADILIIGEAPGADEDRIGRPFVGKSGQLLDKILLACGFTRQEHVFLSNILRCRPPGNRVPKEEEVDKCIAYLYEQIELVNPKIIVPLGATALKRLLNDDSLKITKIRGNWIQWENRLVMPVFHPAALLRNPALKRDTWEDFKKIVYKYRELVNPAHYSEHV